MAFTMVAVGIVIAMLAVFGIRPRGGRQVSNTQMMTAARVVLVALGLGIAFLGWR
jgi:hypothetical protein